MLDAGSASCLRPRISTTTSQPEELLGYFARLFGYRAHERQQRVSQLLDRVGIGAERRMQLRKFSKGMLQRVGIAQALINDPEVIFLGRGRCRGSTHWVGEISVSSFCR